MRLKRAIAQAIVLVLIGAAAGLVHNAFSVNGIDPFRKLDDVPVYDNGETGAVGSGQEDMDGICLVSLDEFREMVDGGMPILDARTAEEYESGHIPGAILCDYFEMGYYFESVLPMLSPEDRIGIYCTGPTCDDSEMLARELYALGYTKLCVYRGGIEKWLEAGLPIEHGPQEGWE
jgi:rhodanese-related sulfurtransferase